MRNLLLMLALCFGGPAVAAKLVDDTGRTVTIDHPAARIIALAPHTTELVFAAGAGDRLVAVAAYSDYPEQALRLPRIGGSGGIDRERLLLYRPDLIIAWDSGSRSSDLAWLDRIGVPVYRSEPESLDDIAKNLRDIGALAGTTEAADHAAAAYERALNQACRQSQPPRPAFYQLWDQPLMTYGGSHWVNDALSRLSLRNIFHDVDRAVFSPTAEAVLQTDAKIVLASTTSQVRLIRPRRIVRVPSAWDRPSPRSVGVLQELCNAIAAP